MTYAPGVLSPSADLEAETMTNYKRPDEEDADAFSRGELVEQEARAVHESDEHPERFATCKLGCWEDAEIAVDNALHAGELVPVLD